MATDNVDLDAFQTQIESKLRQPYSSVELSKILSSTGPGSVASLTGGNVLTPTVFIQNLQKCFLRMTKPIQLRCLIGLLGLEPNITVLYNEDHMKFHESIKELLNSLNGEEKEKKFDKWVIVTAGIVRNKLFGSDLKKCNGDDAKDDVNVLNHRNKKTDDTISKAADAIIKSITEASKDAVDFRNEAEVALTTTNPSEEDEKRMETLLDSFHIGADMNPNFVPWYYGLCSSKTINEILPEIDEKCDFIVNEAADILKVDERLDRRQAEEEKKEEESRKRLQSLAQAKKASSVNNGQKNNGVTGSNPIKRRGIAAGTVGRSTGNDTAALMMRSKVSQSTKSSGSISSRLGTTNAAGGKMRKLGLGRGAAADLVGGKSLANPMSQMNKSRAALLSSKSKLGMVPGGRTAMRTKTKMKMIDVSEVGDLKKEDEERNKRLTIEEKRENKRRKIMENARAKGLKTSKKWGDKSTYTNPNDEPRNDTNSKAIASEDGNQKTSSDTQVHPLDQHDMTFLDPSIYQNPENLGFDWNMDQGHEQQQQYVNANIQQQNNMQSSIPHGLLTKSNKLGPEDRERVMQFFSMRHNPTPEAPVYKMKLNEERSIDPETNMTIKETLFLELDYRTFQYKMSKKIKKK